MTGYRLPAGIISESTDHMNMLGDFIAWMSNDALFEAMNGHSKEGSGGYGRWNAEDYHVSSINYKLEERPETEINSDCAVMIFDAMKDISPFLPKDHVFGFSEGKLGIFHCPITIIEVEPEDKPGEMPLARLKRLHSQFEIIQKAQMEIFKEMLDIRDKAETYQDANSVWIAVAAELASRMEAGNFSMGHILRQITRAIARKG